MGSFISFGDLNPKLSFIILIKIIITVVQNLCEVENFLLKPLLCFFGYFLCFIPLLIKDKCFKNEKSLSKNKLEQANKQIISYIYNNPYERYLRKKDLFIMLAVNLALLFEFFLEIIKNIINSQYNNKNKNNNNNNNESNNINEDFLFFDFLNFYLFSKFLLKTTYYIHQNIAIIGIMIIGIIKFIYNNLTHHSSWHIRGINIILNLIYILIDCIFYGYMKGLMEYKYFSPYKCSHITGLINFPIILIIFIIVLYIPCESEFFCNYNGKENNHFDDINPIFTYDKNPLFGFKIINNNIIMIIIFLIINILNSGVNSVLINITMKDFSLYHIIIQFNIGNFIIYIIKIIKNMPTLFHLIFPLILFFFEFLMYFIFFEIIELNFCNLNKNIKKNIKKRAIDDLLINNEKESFYEEEEENEEEGELMNDINHNK